MIELRHPEVEDGAEVWALAKSTTLDLNTPYSYLMMSKFFGDRCVIAVRDGEIVGFLTGFLVAYESRHVNTFFVWQIAVKENARGEGIARDMIEYLAGIHRLSYVQATVSEENTASMNTFKSIAQKYDTDFYTEMCFDQDVFPNNEKPELIVTIGPIHWVGQE